MRGEGLGPTGRWRGSGPWVRDCEWWTGDADVGPACEASCTGCTHVPVASGVQLRTGSGLRTPVLQAALHWMPAINRPTGYAEAATL